MVAVRYENEFLERNDEHTGGFRIGHGMVRDGETDGDYEPGRVVHVVRADDENNGYHYAYVFVLWENGDVDTPGESEEDLAATHRRYREMREPRPFRLSDERFYAEWYAPLAPHTALRACTSLTHPVCAA